MQYESESDKMIKSFKFLCNVILLSWFFSLAWNALVCFSPLRLFYHCAWPKGVFYWFQGFFVMLCFGMPTMVIYAGLFPISMSMYDSDETLSLGLTFAVVLYPLGLVIMRWMDNHYYKTGLYLQQRQTGF